MSQKPIIDMVSWVLNGDFSEISLGETKDGVVKHLGSPKGWGSTETDGEVEVMNADVWGYGIWTLHFEENTLDSVTCAIHGVDQHGWHFDVKRNIFSVREDIDSVERILLNNEIRCMRFCDDYCKIKNNATGNLIECRKRSNLPAILVGDELRTRIVFEDGVMRGIGNPFSIRRQVLSCKKLDPIGSYMLMAGI